MDHMERYKIQESIKRAIEILDSIPPQRDIVPEANIVKLIDSLSTAHLAIERGLKALISDAGGATKKKHGLYGLYCKIGDFNQEIYKYLSESFDDAVRFYGYNVNSKGFKHFLSLGHYLSKVGTQKSYNALRYWAIEESDQEGDPIPYISTPIHRELLCCLWLAFTDSRRETVSERVERVVAHAVVDGRHRHIAYDPDDTRKKQAVCWYLNWLATEHDSRRAALGQAVSLNFAVSEHEFINDALRDAYEDLKQSKDPAVQYYLLTLTYLPRGSVQRQTDAEAQMDWFNQEEIRGVVVSPAGSHLGLVEKCPDGVWAITPSEEGLVGISAFVASLADARHYLVARLTKLASCVVNGQQRPLRICIDGGSFYRANVSAREWTGRDAGADADTYELECWDDKHGLCGGDRVAIGVVWDEVKGFASFLAGNVIEVEQHKVSIAGSEVHTPSYSLEDWLWREAGNVTSGKSLSTAG